jgi:hypothetical protein
MLKSLCDRRRTPKWRILGWPIRQVKFAAGGCLGEGAVLAKKMT